MATEGTWKSDPHDPHAAAERTLYVVFALLLALLAITVGVARLPLGAWSFPIGLAIAATKAALILLYFMHVREARPLIWLIAGAGFFWLAILIALTLADYRTRNPDERAVTSEEALTPGEGR